jgi:hypothetical protein
LTQLLPVSIQVLAAGSRGLRKHCGLLSPFLQVLPVLRTCLPEPVQPYCITTLLKRSCTKVLLLWQAARCPSSCRPRPEPGPNTAAARARQLRQTRGRRSRAYSPHTIGSKLQGLCWLGATTTAAVAEAATHAAATAAILAVGAGPSKCQDRSNAGWPLALLLLVVAAAAFVADVLCCSWA